MFGLGSSAANAAPPLPANVPAPHPKLPPRESAPPGASPALPGGADATATGDDADDASPVEKQVSTGPAGNGLVFEIWSARNSNPATGSKLLGRCVVTGVTASGGLTPSTEHFFWFDQTVAWKRTSYFLKVVSQDARSEIVPANTQRTDRFNNLIKCNTTPQAVPGSGQWRVTTGGVNAANLVKGASTLFGYWKVDGKCAPIVPLDGWLDLDPVGESYTAKSWGTPPPR